jgi:hypothetical protein
MTSALEPLNLPHQHIGTVSALYCWLPRDVRGANPGIKKWRRGKGTMLTANLRRSAFN